MMYIGRYFDTYDVCSSTIFSRDPLQRPKNASGRVVEVEGGTGNNDSSKATMEVALKLISF